MHQSRVAPDISLVLLLNLLRCVLFAIDIPVLQVPRVIDALDTRLATTSS